MVMGTLNKEQQRAARPDAGHHLVIAGAGTGKTTTLLKKVENLVAARVCRPDEILLLTFSRRAAEELRERLRSRIGDGAGEISAGTFHSFCIRFLRENSREYLDRTGMTSFPDVLEEGEGEAMLEEIIRANLEPFMGLPIRVIAGLVASDFLSPDIKKRISELNLEGEIARVKNLFADTKRQMCRIDFSDMMHDAIELLGSHAELREMVQKKYRYILVDEFQDTSEKNFKLLNFLLGRDTGLFAVGDDWQSIYGFRDARVEYVVNMKKYFPRITIHYLTRNYRSFHEIVEISGAFIKQNRFRTTKKLKSCRGRGGLISHLLVHDSGEEVNAIRQLIESSDIETAVLYRNNWQGRRLISELEEAAGNKDINFMTMHGSKGLEFDRVIIAGVADHIIPDGASDLEEERRLFYVALTRARDELVVVSHLKDEEELPRFGRELALKPGDGRLG